MPDVEKTSTVLNGVVEKVIKPVLEGEPEKAQIAIEGADHLYRELRIENTLVNGKGETVGLKQGAEVDVIIAADPKDTIKKPG